jgi:hypothetical protein
MRFLFAIVAISASTLRADVCRGIPLAPSQLSIEDRRADLHPYIFRVQVKPGGPAFRITIRSFPSEDWQDHFVHAGDVDVVACEDGKLVQTLPIMAEQKINFGGTFQAYDVNFDGYLDISVTKEFAGKWGSSWWWIYDPLSGKFVQNELARELSDLKSNGIDFDAKRREIRTHELLFVCPRSLGDRYRVEKERLVKIHQEDAQPNENGCKVTVSDLVDGKMHLTAVRQYDREGNPVK